MDNLIKLKRNTISTIINRLVLIVSGLIIPRVIIGKYGSETNGLIQSVLQYLSIITLLDMGFGTVIQSNLYKPLSQKDFDLVSAIIKSGENFFKRISFFFIVYIILLIIIFPNTINASFAIKDIIFLIIVLSINIFFQYYFGLTNELLLTSDQKAYIQLNSESFVVCLNIILTYTLINFDLNILQVKFYSSLVLLLRPIFLKYYVKNNYALNKKIILNHEPILQKWNGMAQHLAYHITYSCDIIFLTFFTNLNTISIYSIHNIIISGIGTIINSLLHNLNSFFGNLINTTYQNEFRMYFEKFEIIIHIVLVFMFSMTAISIDSFVDLYTKNVSDISYFFPMFSFLLVISGYLTAIKGLYQNLIFVAGKFRETQISSIIEAFIKLIVTFIYIQDFNLLAVVFASIIALFYKISYLIFFLKKNILQREIVVFLKIMIPNLIVFFFSYFYLKIPICETIMDWIKYATHNSIIVLISAIFINLISNPTFFSLVKTKIRK